MTYRFAKAATLSALLLVASNALAVTYTFRNSTTAPSPATPAICSGGWSKSGSTFTCNGDLSLASGDVLEVRTVAFEPLGDITVVATGAISLSSNTVGTASKNISLRTSSGTLTAIGTNIINGSVTSASGAINLSGTTVSGAVTGTGALSLTGGGVAGNVSASGVVTINSSSIDGTLTGGFGVLSLTGGSVAGNVSSSGSISTSGTTLGGTLTSSNGTISLSGGSVTGLVRSNCCSVTTNGTDLQGGARSDLSNLSITSGILAGTFYAGNNPAVFTGVTMTSGSVSGASTVIFTDSYVGSAESKVSVTSQSGAVTLNNSTVYGDLTAPNYSTINVNTPSTVTGTCLPNSTPANACNASLAPVCFNDSFNRASLGTGDWAVTSRSGAFGVPRINNNLLRLTDNSSDVATAATLQRLLPASANYVQVQFKYNAYGGNGADGVAVVFSDANVTPQPGAFGGPLGYGTKGTADTTGFSGGWLGVGIDEYGNFSGEGGPNSPGQRQDSVAVRGSGSGVAGYRYLAGTAANLSPGIDISGATAGPGHIYRITLDSTAVGKTLVRLERKVGTGSFTTLISSFDVRGASGQAPLPSNFYLSLTGSTGGANNIHELDDLQVCASKLNPIGVQIDHFELSYTSPALTCSPQPVTIKACLNASCSSLYTDSVSVGLSPVSGWTASPPATMSGNTITFSGGTATALLRKTTAGSEAIGTVSDSSVPPTKPFSALVCSTTGCTISYVDSGFLIDVPNMIAAKPVVGSIKAVKKDDTTQACVPGFANVTRSIGFVAGYTNPTTAASLAAGVTTNQPVVVSGSNVTHTATTNISLNFDANGSAPLTVRYDDAGMMALNASYTGNAGNSDLDLSMDGSTSFKSRPYGLCLQTDSTCTVAGVNNNCLAFPGNIRAGDSFPLRVKAVGWQADGEALTAGELCVGNTVTPKFSLANIALSSALVEPVTGVQGSLTPATYSHALGAQTSTAATVSEVGVFRLTATPSAASYLGTETVSGGTSDLVGRFIPAYLGVVGSANLTPSCGSAFSYQGQPMGFATGQEPLLTVTGFNRQKAVTGNYDRGSFWQLAASPSRDAYLSVITGRAGLNARLVTQGSAVLVTSGADNGDGAKSYRWGGEQLLYSPASVPGSNDYPVAAAISQGFTASALTDADGACYIPNISASTTCAAFSYGFGGSEVRLGRLRIGNAHGSELNSLSLPVVLESWQNVGAGSFQQEGMDTCTTSAVLGVPTLDGFTGNLATGKTAASSTAPLTGLGSLLLSAPGSGSDGSVQARYAAMPSWLHFAWDGVSRSEARGLATFGIYKGPKPLIFRRELYR